MHRFHPRSSCWIRNFLLKKIRSFICYGLYHIGGNERNCIFIQQWYHEYQHNLELEEYRNVHAPDQPMFLIQRNGKIHPFIVMRCETFVFETTNYTFTAVLHCQWQFQARFFSASTVLKVCIFGIMDITFPQLTSRIIAFDRGHPAQIIVLEHRQELQRILLLGDSGNSLRFA